MAEKPLTEKQRAFVAAYIGEARGNATQAARLAGYSGGDAACAVMGSELLRHPKVTQAIEVFRLATARASIMDAVEAAERLTQIARGGVGPDGEPLTEKRVVSGGPAGFIETDVQPGFAHQIDAIKALSKMRGYDAPTKSEVAVTPMLAPEAEEALIAMLRSKRK